MVHASSIALAALALFWLAGCGPRSTCVARCYEDASIAPDGARTGDGALDARADAHVPPTQRSACHLRVFGARARDDQRLFLAVVREEGLEPVAFAAFPAAAGDFELTLHGVLERGRRYRLEYFYDYVEVPWTFEVEEDAANVPVEYLACRSNLDLVYRAPLRQCEESGLPADGVIQHQMTFREEDQELASCDVFPVPGDLDGNRCVDEVDLDLCLAHLGVGATLGGGAERSPGDVDFDGSTTLVDAYLIARAYQLRFPCGGAP